MIGRREFTNVAWWLGGDLVRRSGRSGGVNRARLVGVLMATAADEDQQVGLNAFLQVPKQLGWVEGRNVRFDLR